MRTTYIYARACKQMVVETVRRVKDLKVALDAKKENPGGEDELLFIYVCVCVCDVGHCLLVVHIILTFLLSPLVLSFDERPFQVVAVGVSSIISSWALITITNTNTITYKITIITGCVRHPVHPVRPVTCCERVHCHIVQFNGVETGGRQWPCAAMIMGVLALYRHLKAADDFIMDIWYHMLKVERKNDGNAPSSPCDG